MHRLNRQARFIPVSLKPTPCKETGRISVGFLEAFFETEASGTVKIRNGVFWIKISVSYCDGMISSEPHTFSIYRAEYVSSVLIQNLVHDVFTRLRSTITHKTSMPFFL